MKQRVLWTRLLLSVVLLMAFAVVSQGQDLASFEKRVTVKVLPTA